MEQYLIWINLGGDVHAPCTQEHYRICQGENEEQAVHEWITSHGFDSGKIEYKSKGWRYEGNKVNVFKLVKNNDYNGWKRLKWVSV